MKKLLIIALLFVGCSLFEEEDKCVFWVYSWAPNVYAYRCYAEVYTKKECMDKQVKSFDYYSFVEESCSEFCSSIKSDCPSCGCIEY